MRPTAAESIRAIQAAIADQILPELTTPFAQEAASASNMLLESLAAEIDTAAQDLRDDNEALRAVLTHARDTLGQSNENAQRIVNLIDGVLDQAGDGSITVSGLATQNDRLRAVLEQLLELIEDTNGEPGRESLAPVREEAYRHLRIVAVRGWSFFDVSGFRERIVKARAELS